MERLRVKTTVLSAGKVARNRLGVVARDDDAEEDATEDGADTRLAGKGAWAAREQGFSEDDGALEGFFDRNIEAGGGRMMAADKLAGGVVGWTSEAGESTRSDADEA